MSKESLDSALGVPLAWEGNHRRDSVERSRVSARDWIWILLILAASSLVSFMGIGPRLPLDAHEVFVAKTAEEMHERGSLLVPYFNGVPRLKKPPMEYWLVMAFDSITGGDGVVTEAEARFPSALAGLAMTAMAIGTGWLLAGRGVGLLTGAMLATCNALVTYTHSARPEMVYAVFCTAGLLGFVLAERWSGDEPRRSWSAPIAFAAWLCFGLAMLTKGPQLVLPIVAGWLVGAWRAGTFRQSARAIRPMLGVPLCLIVGLWWYAYVLLTVPNAAEILKIETIDRITSQGKPWYTLFDPYYLYVPIIQILPWVFFVPGALAGPWLRRLRTPAGSMRMWWIVLATGLVLSLSRGRRWYYMLPVLVPMVLLLASTATLLVAMLWKDRSTWKWALLMGAHAVGVNVLASTSLDRHAELFGNASAWLRALPLAVIAIAGVLFGLPARRRALGPIGVGVCACLLASIGLAVGESRGAFWRSNRFDERAFALWVAEHVPTGATIVGWRDPFEEQIYYLRRTIPIYEDPNDLAAAVRRLGSAWVLVDIRNSSLEVPSDLAANQVITWDNGKVEGQLELWKVEAGASGAP